MVKIYGRLTGFCLTIGLIAMLMAGCTSTTTPAPSLTSIAIRQPLTANLAVGARQYFYATETTSDGTTAGIYEGTNLIWKSSNPSVATVGLVNGVDPNSNLVMFQVYATGVAAGTTTITATMNGMTSNSYTLQVVAPTTLVSIAVTPVASPFPLATANNSIQQYIAVGKYSDGSTADITSLVTWVSSNTTCATMNAMGWANAGATPGATTNITAKLGSITSPEVVFKT